jgi:hypothetical protein
MNSPSAPDPEPERATAGAAEQDPDDPPQDADRNSALIVVACIAAAVLLAGAGGVVLALPSQGSNDARNAAATDPGPVVAVAPIVDSASPSHAAGPATPAPAPSPGKSVPASAPARPSRTPAPATPSAAAPAPAPSPGFGPLVAGTYTIDRILARTSSPALTVTLTQVTVAAGGAVTVDVTYHNTGSSALVLSCGGVNDATVNLLARSDGKTYRATRSFCSDHPSDVFVLSASGASGSSRQSYAVFAGVTGQNSDFTFTWQSGQSVTGVVPGVVL